MLMVGRSLSIVALSSSEDAQNDKLRGSDRGERRREWCKRSWMRQLGREEGGIRQDTVM